MRERKEKKEKKREKEKQKEKKDGKKRMKKRKEEPVGLQFLKGEDSAVGWFTLHQVLPRQRGWF